MENTWFAPTGLAQMAPNSQGGSPLHVQQKGQPACRKGGQRRCSQAVCRQEPPYISRYVAVDSHLVERKGSSDSVSSVAGERPAGRKFAQEIAAICNQLHREGYEVFSLIPTVGGRTVEVFSDEDESESQDLAQASPTDPVSDLLRTVAARPMKPREPAIVEYEPMAAGYSVTDGVIITAELRA